jgi:PAS domain S-box-containing protein
LPPDAEVTYEIYRQGIHPEERERIAADYQAALDPTGTGRFGFEHRTVGRDDGVIRWVHAAGHVVFDAQSRPVRVIGTVRDITERKMAEEALRASEARYRQVVEASLQGIWVHRNGRIIFANAYAVRMFGAQNLEELIGKSVLELVHPEERSRAAGRMKQLAERGGSVPLTEMRFLGPGGRTMPLEVQAVSFEDQGQPVVLAVGRDISERKASEERQALLMAELDHRVRNILASVQSMASLTARSATTKEEYSEKLQGRIAAMARVHEMLTQRHWDGADVADIIRNGLQAHSEAVAIRGDPGFLLRARDALNLALVLHELATNAAKYGALSVPEGKVDVSWSGVAENGDQKVHILWRESGGPTVQPPTRRGFGSRFIQATLSSVALEFDPAGVQCKIELKHRQPGSVSERLVRDVKRRAEQDAAKEESPLRGLQLLLVEDEAIAALELQSVLESAGADVAVATNLHEAVALARRDLGAAVLDINLEGEMSYPVAESLIARGVPIVFVTGYDAAQFLPRHLQGVPVLQKPIDGAALVRQLAELTRPAGQ